MASGQLQQRILEGIKIQSRDPESVKDYEKYRADAAKWWEFNITMLANLFTDVSVPQKYSNIIPPEVLKNWQRCSFVESYRQHCFPKNEASVYFGAA
jgi:hypothetical protein